VYSAILTCPGSLQQPMDDLLRPYEHLLPLFQDYQPTDLWAKLACIILYDQVPRNIFRKRARAYQYDNISRKIALDLFETYQNVEQKQENCQNDDQKLDQEITVPKDKVALQFWLTILICLVHSENLQIQLQVQQEVQFLKQVPMYSTLKVVEQMKIIAKNHCDRISWFGRIPERNQCLGRKSTEQEEVYLKSLY